MTRKLFSMMLCAFALLLLMGAGVAPEEPVTILAEEESAAAAGSDVLETEIPSLDKVSSQENSEAAGAGPLELAEDAESEVQAGEEPAPEENVESGLLIDGAPAPAEVSMTAKDGVTYVALAPMAEALDGSAQVSWNASAKTVTVTTDKLRLTAKVGQLYLVANGRYLYLPEKVQAVDGRVIVPLWAAAKAFDASVRWNAATGVITVTRGSGAIQAGESYYSQETLYWLSRVIYAESANQPLEGQMAVGNVVMNRVASPVFPNSVEAVLAQKNQFSTYKSGKITNCTPNETSIIAAKLVLDGGVVEESNGALYFDSTVGSWAARNKECIATIGGHKFYR